MRLVTRADLDGLACALIINDREDLGEIVLVHPQEITDKTVEILPGDILANLPYHPRPVMVHHVPRFLADRFVPTSKGGDTKQALVVVDGLALDQWISLRDSLRSACDCEESAVFAWVPTLTSISRQNSSRSFSSMRDSSSCSSNETATTCVPAGICCSNRSGSASSSAMFTMTSRGFSLKS